MDARPAKCLEKLGLLEVTRWSEIRLCEVGEDDRIALKEDLSTQWVRNQVCPRGDQGFEALLSIRNYSGFIDLVPRYSLTLGGFGVHFGAQGAEGPGQVRPDLGRSVPPQERPRAPRKSVSSAGR